MNNQSNDAVHPVGSVLRIPLVDSERCLNRMPSGKGFTMFEYELLENRKVIKVVRMDGKYIFQRKQDKHSSCRYLIVIVSVSE